MNNRNSLEQLAPEAANRIPTPANRWFSRLLIPVGIVGATVVLLLAMGCFCTLALSPRRMTMGNGRQ